MVAPCPFCASVVDERVPVCPTCGRDIAIPETLRREHQELLHKRDRLRAELAEVRAKLLSRTRPSGAGS